MTTIYFVRHAEAENPEGIYYGRIPGFHLSKHGEEQAEKLGKYFEGKPIETIYTSPLERTYETANIIGKHLPHAKIIHEYDLIEANMPSWQGLKYDEAYKNEEHERFINDSKAKLQGENLTQLASRMKSITQKLIASHSGKEIICLTHEFPITALELALKEHPLEELKAINRSSASITKLVFDETGKLTEDDYIELQ